MKIKLRTARRVGMEAFLLNICVFCVLTYALLEHASIYVPIISVIKMPLLYTAGACVLLRLPALVKHWKKKRYFYIMSLMVLMCLVLLLSAYMNRNTTVGYPPMLATMRLILYMMEMMLLMVWLAETGRSRYFLNYLFYYVLVLTILTDVLMFTGVLQRWAGTKDAYLVGTKFTVSYFHMNLLTLWFVRNKQQLSYSDRKAKRVILLGAPVVVLVAAYMNCITGIVGCLLLLVLFMLLNTRLQTKVLRLNSPVVLVILMSISLIFPFIADWFTSLPSVAYVVKNILNRDLSLTGRLDIFALFGNEMEGHWLWGFGFGNGNAAAVKLFGYANAQNALLHWILQAGVPVTVLLVLLMILCFRQLGRSRQLMRCMPFVLLIHVYTIIGFIETTYSMTFLLWLGVLFMLTNERPEQPNQSTARG